MDIIVVKKSGPVASMKFRAWWIYFIFCILLVLLAGLAASSYLLQRQHMALMQLSEDNQLLTLRTERLENIIQNQETAAVLAQVQNRDLLETPEGPKPEKNKPAKPAASPSAEEKAAAKNSAATDSSAEEAAAADEEQKPREVLPGEPTESNLVGIGGVDIKRRGSELVVVFDVQNKAEESNKPAAGYVTVISRSERKGAPHVDSWPTMRLTLLGRPLNFRRGTPFSVMHYRRLKARFARGDKKIKRLEFLVYSREGELLLVVKKDLEAKGNSSTKSNKSPGKGRA